MRIRIDQLPPAMQGQVRAKLAEQYASIHNSAEPSERHAPEVERASAIHAHSPNKTEQDFRDRFLDSTAIYEGITFRLPGGSRYTPDWVTFDDGIVTVYEVKGSYRFPSQGRALTAWREARAAFPFVSFRWFCKKKDGEWEERSVECFRR